MGLVKELFIVRHGETDYNKQRIIQGRGVDSSLNAKGRKQAKALFDYYKDYSFDAVYASALVRTHQTLAHFEDLGHTIQKDANLDEIDWGEHEGRKGTPALKVEYTQITQQWIDGNYHFRIKGGESPLEVQQRLNQFLEEALHQESHDKVLICTHGRTSRILFCTLLNWELSKMQNFQHRNTGVAKFVADGDTYKLEFYNNIDHLVDD